MTRLMTSWLPVATILAGAVLGHTALVLLGAALWLLQKDLCLHALRRTNDREQQRAVRGDISVGQRLQARGQG